MAWFKRVLCQPESHSLNIVRARLDRSSFRDSSGLSPPDNSASVGWSNGGEHLGAPTYTHPNIPSFVDPSRASCGPFDGVIAIFGSCLNVVPLAFGCIATTNILHDGLRIRAPRLSSLSTLRCFVIRECAVRARGNFHRPWDGRYQREE